MSIYNYNVATPTCKKHQEFYMELRRLEILKGFCGVLSEFLDLNKLFRLISRIDFIILDFLVFSGKINFI
jgi:hypothetical protein